MEKKEGYTVKIMDSETVAIIVDFPCPKCDHDAKAYIYSDQFSDDLVEKIEIKCDNCGYINSTITHEE